MMYFSTILLSVEGEEQTKKLSKNIELQNIDVIGSSNYTRAKATAKYFPEFKTRDDESANDTIVY